ncbi:hypothetical protein [Bacillus sp. JCM 19034]|uniref:hypothetical protein n=1 Tax=Bacillus sp. JCM 19034 TaxID=1481928 RepID=UPI0012E1144E|nr:hypothetical protein [Bacillus sp. JCM 19034]
MVEEDAGEECIATFIYSKLHIRSSENEVIICFTEVINEIAITGVCFKNHRKGYLTRLISLLKDYGRANNYKVIKLESCNEKAANYAKKHGFIQALYEYDYYAPVIEGTKLPNLIYYNSAITVMNEYASKFNLNHREVWDVFEESIKMGRNENNN